MRRDVSLIPLSHQHQHALALCVMVRRQLNEANVAAMAQQVVDAFKAEISSHFELEEKVLFPLCAWSPLIPGLLDDHRAIEALVSSLRVTPSKAALEELCDRLPAHVRREESELFEQIQRHMAPEALARAGGEIREWIDADHRPGQA